MINLLMMKMVTKMIGDDFRDIDDTYNGGVVSREILGSFLWFFC